MLKQTFSLMAWNFRSLRTRREAALIAVAGFFAVIFVFVAVLSIAEGLRQSVGSDLNGMAVVYSQSIGSTLPLDSVKLVGNASGVAQGPRGPLVVGTDYASMELPKWGGGLYAEAGLRGVGPDYTQVIPHFHIVRGRMFRPGVDEIMAGVGAADEFPALSLGKTLHWHNRDWKIVGIYSTGNALRDSESITDVHEIQSLKGQGNNYSLIYARLASPADFAAFKTALTSDPRLAVSVERLSDFEREFASTLDLVIETADAVITALMAVGAIFGALNIMYANVAARLGEMATLRALGFARLPILASVLMEALVLALVGGGLGVVAAWLAFDGYTATTAVGGSLTQFHFAVTPFAVAAALGLTLVMGFAGGLLPALRAARLPIAKSLRET
ncbi:MAG: ABC transporter permease [Rhizomicrobium sp.]